MFPTCVIFMREVASLSVMFPTGVPAAVICIEYNPVVCYCKQEAIFVVVVCCFLIVNMYTTASVALTALALTLQELHTTSTPAVEIVVAFTDLVCSPSRGVIFTFS